MKKELVLRALDAFVTDDGQFVIAIEEYPEDNSSQEQVMTRDEIKQLVAYLQEYLEATE